MNKTATAMNETAISSTGGSEELKKVKELEKRVVKLFSILRDDTKLILPQSPSCFEKICFLAKKPLLLFK